MPEQLSNEMSRWGSKQSNFALRHSSGSIRGVLEFSDLLVRAPNVLTLSGSNSVGLLSKKTMCLRHHSSQANNGSSCRWFKWLLHNTVVLFLRKTHDLAQWRRQLRDHPGWKSKYSSSHEWCSSFSGTWKRSELRGFLRFGPTLMQPHILEWLCLGCWSGIFESCWEDFDTLKTG